MIALASVPPIPYLFGLARLCMIRTISDISISPSQLTSPHFVALTSGADEVVTVEVVASDVDVTGVEVTVVVEVMVVVVTVVVVVEVVVVVVFVSFGLKPDISLKSFFNS